MQLPKMHLSKHVIWVKNNLKFSYLGKQPYQDTYKDMKKHIQNFSSNQIWMLEHDAVFTLGTAAEKSHIINPGQIPVIQTDRGGEVTIMDRDNW